jgi:hypothetical protein
MSSISSFLTSVLFYIICLQQQLITTCCTAAAAAAANAADVDTDDCPLWIAKSNTNNNGEKSLFTKYGLYAGRPYPKHSMIPYSELSIPLVDYFGDYNRQSDLSENVLNFMEDHLWTPAFIGSRWEGNHTSPAFILGVGLLTNYHTSFSNVDFSHASILKREPLVSRDGIIFPQSGVSHLLRGAVTPYYNATMKATKDIPVGMELFAYFGGEEGLEDECFYFLCLFSVFLKKQLYFFNLF